VSTISFYNLCVCRVYFICSYLHKLSHTRGYRVHYLSNELLGNISIGSCVPIKAQCTLVISAVDSCKACGKPAKEVRSWAWSNLEISFYFSFLIFFNNKIVNLKNKQIFYIKTNYYNKKIMLVFWKN